MEEAVSAADFKARCLELMDRVRETGAEYIVTKHGRPVARLVPYVVPKGRKTMFGPMKGTVLKFERPSSRSTPSTISTVISDSLQPRCGEPSSTCAS